MALSFGALLWVGPLGPLGVGRRTSVRALRRGAGGADAEASAVGGVGAKLLLMATRKHTSFCTLVLTTVANVLAIRRSKWPCVQTRTMSENSYFLSKIVRCNKKE